MARTISKNARRWERLLQVLVNGGVITKEQIGASMQYDAIYRLSTEMWWLKKQGAVVKTHKTGRTVTGYELMNVKEMLKVLKDRGFAPLALVGPKAKPVKAPVTKAVTKAATKPTKAKTTKAKPVKPMDELKTQATPVTEQVTEVSTDDGVEITE